MGSLGIPGVMRSRRVKTTQPDATALRHPDPVKQALSSGAPNQSRVTYLTFVPTQPGIAYVSFSAVAYSGMIVGWRVSRPMRTETVLDAIEMPRGSRGQHLPGLRRHSDAVSQFTSIRYGGRLTEISSVPSIGTLGNSFANHLAETVNGYEKAKFSTGPKHPGSSKIIKELEKATSGGNTGTTRNVSRILGDPLL